MIDSQQGSAPNVASGRVEAEWRGESVPVIFANEALLHHVNDQVYISFGQIVIQPVSGVASSVHIQPVAQIVMPEQSFRKLAAMFNRVIERLPAPLAPAGEE
jgi:hypothetical protein